jgi:T4-like virus Myoviridae tail sheath stabiliser
MDYFYDGQIRRYVTQFMRVFIGFKYKTGDGVLKHVPVTYGDMTRQVASIIKENSENKMPSVPKISCYISGLEMDSTRLADASFVSKLNIRERAWEEVDGQVEYQNYQGGGYTVERLMPTPFKLSMKADIWTSSTDQKLQLTEQILVLFNPSLEIQTTDNYIDWTSLSVIDLSSINFTSRSIPVGTESDIDVCSLEFKMPIYISPPAKVKKLGVVRNLIMNVFGETGDVLSLDDLIYNDSVGGGRGGIVRLTAVKGDYRVLLLKSNNGQSNDYDLSIVSPAEVVASVGLLPPFKLGDKLDWAKVLDLYGGYVPQISKIYFLQPDGSEIGGTFVINELDPTLILVSIDEIPSNTVIIGPARSPNQRSTIDAIIDPYKYNPKRPNKETEDQAVVPGTRFLMLDDVNPNNANEDGPDAWKNSNGSDPVIRANTIIEWSGTAWIDLLIEWQISNYPINNTVIYVAGQIVTYQGVAYRASENITNADNVVIPADNSKFQIISIIFQNLKTGLQYRRDGSGQWFKSFEGEYASGYWRFDLDPA